LIVQDLFDAFSWCDLRVRYILLDCIQEFMCLSETKRFFYDNFKMKDMNEVYYVIGIEIFHDKSQGLLGLS